MRYLLLLAMVFAFVGCGEVPVPDAQEVCGTVCSPLAGTSYEGMCVDQCEEVAGHVVGEVSAALCARCHEGS